MRGIVALFLKSSQGCVLDLGKTPIDRQFTEGSMSSILFNAMLAIGNTTP